MRISVILAHPDPKSFNHAIAQTAVEALKINGHQAILHDLYQENFDPLLHATEISEDAKLPATIKKHCEEIAIANGIVIVHPNWWGQPPAILKGWVDRIIRPGVAYEFLEGDSGEGVPRGLLKAKTALVYNTSNTEAKREKDVFGDPLETIWKNCIFRLCGVKHSHRRTFNVIVTSTEKQRKNWLKNVRQDVDLFFPLITIKQGDEYGKAKRNPW
ncbi:MAG: NAD(P)H dehydrogenase [Smithella sp. SDB]|nr:MAG: NAD(P)H dehydrogenase [Smithella sp. SDB]